jgi:citrate synthase
MKATHTLRRLALGMVVPVNAPQSLSVRASPQLYPLLFGSRCVATQGISADCDLKCAFAEAIPSLQERLKNIKTSFGSKSLGEVTVNMALGGMRGVPGLLWETSLLDAEDGIRFRGHTITELKQKLPKATPSGEPLPEGLLWLLLTGNVPSKQQAVSLSAGTSKES